MNDSSYLNTVGCSAEVDDVATNTERPATLDTDVRSNFSHFRLRRQEFTRLAELSDPIPSSFWLVVRYEIHNRGKICFSFG